MGHWPTQALLHVFGEDGERGYRRCTAIRHQHLVCRNCGLVLERDAPALDNWVTRTATAAGFSVQEHRTEVRGLCRICLAHGGTNREAPAASVRAGAVTTEAGWGGPDVGSDEADRPA